MAIDNKESGDVVARNERVVMARWNLDGLPEYPLREGYCIRRHRPGDRDTWLAVHKRSEKFQKVSVGMYVAQFGMNVQVLAERQLFLEDADGHAVGTATAWYDHSFHGFPSGRVHWVAVVPEAQGKGLSLSLLSAVCVRLRELDHDRAYLRTSTARVAAINLYLKFGFVPFLEREEHARVWRELADIVKYPVEDAVRNDWKPTKV